MCSCRPPAAACCEGGECAPAALAFTIYLGPGAVRTAVRQEGFWVCKRAMRVHAFREGPARTNARARFIVPRECRGSSRRERTASDVRAALKIARLGGEASLGAE